MDTRATTITSTSTATSTSKVKCDYNCEYEPCQLFGPLTANEVTCLLQWKSTITIAPKFVLCKPWIHFLLPKYFQGIARKKRRKRRETFSTARATREATFVQEKLGATLMTGESIHEGIHESKWLDSPSNGQSICLYQHMAHAKDTLNAPAYSSYSSSALAHSPWLPLGWRGVKG